jgi:hypothetical protein
MYAVQVCLSVTRAPPGCEDSAIQGTLQSIFLSTDAFSVSSPLSMSLRDAGPTQPDLDTPFCTDAGARLTSCRGVDMSALVSERFSLAATFTSNAAANLSWSWVGADASRTEQSLGCFVIKGSPFFRAPDIVQGLRLGVTYTNTTSDGLGSRMVGSICGPALPQLNTSAASPLRFIAAPLPQGEVDRQGLTGVVCTDVTIERVSTDVVGVCLSTTNSATAASICRGSAGRGRLTGVFFGTEPFQSPGAQLGVENGAIKAQRPSCSGSGDVTACGAANISTPLNSRLNFDVGFALSAPISFGSASASLGCFYVTGFDAALFESVGWDVGLTFDNINGDVNRGAKMAARLYREDALPTVAQCQYNTINARMPLRTTDPTDQVCTAVKVTAVASNTLEVRTRDIKKAYRVYICAYY